MSKAVIGIDPGKFGGIVGIKDDIIKALSIPLINNKIDMIDLVTDFRELFYFDKNFSNAIVYIEKVASMPKQSVKSMFSFGRVYGIFEMLFASHGYPIERVTPKKWQKAVLPNFEKGKSKEAALLYVKERFPDFWDMISEGYTKKEREGLIDAFLIAQYGKYCQNGNS